MTAAAAGAVLVVALAGCGTPEPSKPTPTPVFSSEEEAFAAAEETYRAYVDALNQVDLSDPNTFEPIYDLTTGDANAGARKTFSRMHAEGLIVSGPTVAAVVEPRQMGGGDPISVELAVCLDVSEVTVTDAAGASAVSPNRPDVQSILVTIEFEQEDEPHGLISSIDGREGEPTCT